MKKFHTDMKKRKGKKQNWHLVKNAFWIYVRVSQIFQLRCLVVVVGQNACFCFLFDKNASMKCWITTPKEVELKLVSHAMLICFNFLAYSPSFPLFCVRLQRKSSLFRIISSPFYSSYSPHCVENIYILMYVLCSHSVRLFVTIYNIQQKFNKTHTETSTSSNYDNSNNAYFTIRRGNYTFKHSNVKYS